MITNMTAEPLRNIDASRIKEMIQRASLRAWALEKSLNDLAHEMQITPGIPPRFAEEVSELAIFDHDIHERLKSVIEQLSQLKESA